MNLLPPKQKQELLLEEKFRIVLILGIIITAFLISFIFILISIKIFISAEAEIQKINLAQKEQESGNATFQEIENKIITANAVFSQLADFYHKQRDNVVIFKEIFDALPSGVYLTNLSFNSANSQFSIAGFSPSRELLLKLKENLEKENNFSAVYFPPTNWIEPVDINFSLNFKIRW